MKVGDKVTRSNGSKVWEIGRTATVQEAFGDLSPHYQAIYGQPTDTVYRLRDTRTGKLAGNVWWTAKNLRPAN